MKQILRNRFPRIYTAAWRLISPYRLALYYTCAVTRMRVISGQFKGMRYRPVALGSSVIPKLAGTYEWYIGQWIADIIDHPPQAIIDVGCSEGYYAVGLAMRCPTSTIYAYDVNPLAADACRRLSVENDVFRQIEFGSCFHAKHEIRNILQGATVILDCEGAEDDILAVDQIPAFANSTLIIETHDCFRPGITASLIARLAGTHEIESVKFKTEAPPLDLRFRILPGSIRRHVWNEDRRLNNSVCEQVWLRAIPRSVSRTRGPND